MNLKPKRNWICPGSWAKIKINSKNWIGKEIQSKIKQLISAKKTYYPSKQQIHKILEMVKLHYLMHPLIPSEDGSFRNFMEIRRQACLEMLQFCIQEKLADTLIKSNKYHICRYRTSVMVESHYRILKRDFLSIFGRPVSIIIFRI